MSVAINKHYLGFSVKNVPIPSPDSYREALLHSTVDFVNRIRWKAFFYDRKTSKQDSKIKINFGLKSYKSPPPNPALSAFERDLFMLIKNIKISRLSNLFQDELRSKILEIRKSPDIFVLSDKTGNLYSMSPRTYNGLITKELHSKYKLARVNSLAEVNESHFDCLSELDLLDRSRPYTPKVPHCLLKDHKPDFISNPSIRLICPTKSDLGKVSKGILDRMIGSLRKKVNVSLWNYTGDVIAWFCNLKGRGKLSFIQFDISDYYCSISPILLNKALIFARGFVEVTDLDIRIVLAARKTLIKFNEELWQKAGSVDMFDVTMGSLDSAQLTDLVGIYLLYNIQKSFPVLNGGLYRDDALFVVRETSKSKIRRLEKNIRRFLKEFYCLDVVYDVNHRVINFLDVTLDLDTGLYSPYIKPHKCIQYISTQSNHPWSTIKGVVISISVRLSNLSANGDIFDRFAPYYNKALRSSGFTDSISYMENTRFKIALRGYSTFETHACDPPLPKYHHFPHRRYRGDYYPHGKSSNNNRIREVIWFAPPFSLQVRQLPRLFFKLLDSHFPKGHKFYSFLNRSSIKFSYSAMPNIGNIIAASNRGKLVKALAEYNRSIGSCNISNRARSCNCRNPENCPLEGNCLTTNVVYKATVREPGRPDKFYIGSTVSFKPRYRAHLSSFSNVRYACSTTLASYIHLLKNNGSRFSVVWSIIARSPGFSMGTGPCGLCIKESLMILKNYNSGILNKFTDVLPFCCHGFASTFLKLYRGRLKTDD